MNWDSIVLFIFVCIASFIAFSALFYKRFFKRIYDIILSGIAIIILSPLLLILTILGALKMKGNPFFIQKRPGKNDKTGNEKIFSLIKFRSMTEEKDKKGKYLPDEVRLTRYGKILRSTSLDELPELFNIFKGDMSIVGPRPQLVRDMVFMSKEQRKRHDVLPGLTGLAQVRGRNAISWEDKLKTDLEYVSKYSLLLDIKIIFMTVVKVFKREGISEDGEVTATDLGDYLLNRGLITEKEYERKQKEAQILIEKTNGKV